MSSSPRQGSAEAADTCRIGLCVVALLAGRVQFLRRRACASFAPVGVHAIINWESHARATSLSRVSGEHLLELSAHHADGRRASCVSAARAAHVRDRLHPLHTLYRWSREYFVRQRRQHHFCGRLFREASQSRYQRPAPRDRHARDRARRRDGARQARDDAQRSSR